MRVFTFFFLFIFSMVARALPVSFVFDSIRLVDLARLNFSEVQKQNFILDSDFIADTKQVAFEVKDIDAEQFGKAVEDLLLEHGYRVVNEGKILAVRRFDKEREEFKKSENEKEIYIYRPRHRSVNFLTDLVTRFFPTTSFSHQRPIEQPQPGQHQPQAQAQRQLQPAQENAQSAFGQIGKDHDVIVFNGSPAEIKKLQVLFDQLDTQVSEVLINAVVYEVKNSDSKVSAVDLALSLLGGKFVFNVASGAITGGFRSAGGVTNFSALFSLLSSDNRFRVVTSPRVRVRSGSSATFSVGDDVPVLGNATVTQTGQVVQSVEYKPSGVIFSVLPTVRQDVVDLHISQQISNFVPTTNGVNNSPTLTKREFTSDVIAKNDELILIGGLDENNDTAGSSGWSFLPRFTDKKSSSNSHTEILLLLHVQRI